MIRILGSQPEEVSLNLIGGTNRKEESREAIFAVKKRAVKYNLMGASSNGLRPVPDKHGTEGSTPPAPTIV